MNDLGYNTWMYRIGFVLLGVALIVLRLLPLQTTPQTWAGPDVMLCLVFAWSLRRPDYVPTLLIAAVILLEDFLLQRPPGLHAALIVGVSFWLKSKADTGDEQTMTGEIAQITIAVLGVLLATRLILALALLPRPSLTVHFAQALSTIIFYPVMALTSAFVMNVRPIKKSET
jgi:rod shape-determining protein MreD